ncbi:ClpP-like prohead protease/major capsid protein fusion protein [Delftia acidovorans]|uniref:ClpP-like prohead protease/major capsid protein fusion protein n=1 Tax=Delftia acidovorans TaxID=80866 RepID=UPI000F8278D1|nr:ClpP-like prohead protease/major capsid protein fusion protein [Delftia acidovorans]
MSTSQKWYAIRRKSAMAAAAAGTLAAAEIFIYGDIGESWWDETVSARDFVAELQALDVEAITIRINSVGGSVPDGLAIYNAMRRHKATVTVEVDGMAFSIASLIAMGGDKVHMADNAMLMIHAPWTYAAGNAAELRDLADQLDTWAAAMATSYAARTNDHDGALALLTDGKDHYYTAAEAKAAGFVDEVTEAHPIAASASRDLPISRYRSLPSALAQTVGSSAATAAPSAPQEESMNKNRKHSPQNAIGASGAAAAGGGSAAPAAATAPDAASVLAADQTRRQSIRTAFAAFSDRPGVVALQQTCEDDYGITAEAAGARLLAHLGSQATPVAGLATVEDETDKRRGAAVAALLVRAGYATKDQVAAQASNPYRGMSLVEMARASLERIGVSARGMDKRDLVAAAFTQSTSDFPILLTDAIHRTLLSAYSVQALTWQRFCKRGSVSDFRAHHRLRAGSLGNLQPKNELGEYKSIAIPDGEKSSISADTKGYIINLSREMVINDDLGALTDQAAAMGRSAARTVETDVYKLLAENNGMGPTMDDGKTLLHADHGNVVTAAAGPTTQSFQDFRVLMAKHKDISKNDFLNLLPAVWLGPLGLEALAKLVNQAQYEPSTSKNALTPNISLGLFRDIVGSPRLEGTRHYALTDPNEAAAIEVAFLDGVDTPFLEQESAFTTDGTRFKVRLDYGVGAHDWRGIATNAGA